MFLLFPTGENCEVNIDECESAPCLNGAACVDGVNNYTCSCLPGFEGRQCQVNIDECAPEPCLNGGSCQDGINQYLCRCDGTGFEGQHCELNIDECAPEPCVNNATCHDGVNEYKCECFAGYDVGFATGSTHTSFARTFNVSSSRARTARSTSPSAARPPARTAASASS